MEKSKGSLYLDDGESLQYREGQSLKLKFKFLEGKLSIAQIGKVSASFADKCGMIDSIIVLGLKKRPENIVKAYTS